MLYTGISWRVHINCLSESLTLNPSSAFILHFSIMQDKDNFSPLYSIFMPPPNLKGPPGDLVIRWCVCLFVCLSFCLSIIPSHLQTKSNIGWWYSNQNWAVISSMGSSHFTDITCPRGWAGSKFRTEIFAIFWLICCQGHLRFSKTYLVVLWIFSILSPYKSAPSFTKVGKNFRTIHPNFIRKDDSFTKQFVSHLERFFITFSLQTTYA